jgi:2-oxoglutarate dehydrogenase E2 component (dihydrolipoamide succinyltransferase)
VLELETDKVTMEVPAPAAGALGDHKFGEGDTVEVGAVVASIDESASKPESVGASAGKDEKQAEASGGSSDSGSSDSGKSDSKQAASDAAAKSEAPKPGSGSGQSTGNPSGSKPSAAPASNGSANATPLARKLADDHGVDLGNLTGTGAQGRIREQDVLAYVQAGGNGKAPSASSAPARSTSVTRTSPLRQRVASRLVEAQQTAAMLTTFNECDMTEVMALRSRHKEAFGEKHGVNLGFMSFFVKAVVRGLQAQPSVNSYIVEDDDGKPAIRSHDYCDIAIAVASPKGLVVPVLRNAEKLSFAEIESGIKDLAVRARDGKIALEEMSGGTFTITNGGIFGSLMSTPILNPPQSGILGMHAIKKRAVEDPANPGQVALRPMMYLALSYDHRIVDGEGAVKFLVAVKEAIEQPETLLLDL